MGEVVVVIHGGATVVSEADAPRVLGMFGAREATPEEASAFLAARHGGVMGAQADGAPAVSESLTTEETPAEAEGE